MKIGFLVGTLGRGGAERQLTYMLQALQKEKIETRVLCLTKGEAFEEEIRALNIDIDWIGDSPSKLARLNKLIKNLRSRPVDIVQSTHFYTNIYAAGASRILGVSNIGAIRNDLHSEIAANRTFARWHLRLPQKLIANSKLAVDRAIAKGIAPASIDLVRNVVLEKDNKALRRSANEDVVRILFVGRLVKQKRPELFIQLASRLSNELADTNLEFIVAGDGPLRADLERQATDLGLFENSRIKFVGELASMSELYLSSDVLVLTSDHEGTPNVLLEAMAHGLPLVATRVGGVPEIVAEDCGIVIEPRNVTALIDATRRLVLDKELREKMGQKGQLYVRKYHSIDYLRERLMGIYSKLLETPTTNGETQLIR